MPPQGLAGYSMGVATPMEWRPLGLRRGECAARSSRRLRANTAAPPATFRWAESATQDGSIGRIGDFHIWARKPAARMRGAGRAKDDGKAGLAA